MLFFASTQDYLIFLVALAAVYIAIVNYLQGHIGGKNRLANLQKEMRDMQMAMMEASKRNDTKAIDEAVSQNWKLTSELLKIQMTLTICIIAMLLVLSPVFNYIEPLKTDDVTFQLYNDSLASHCNAGTNGSVFSNCLTIPENATEGAWVVDVFLKDAQNNTVSHNATAIYIGGGQPSDVWLQASAQNSFIDILTGKTAYYLNVTSDNGNYTLGQTAAISATVSPALPPGYSLEAISDSGTFFHIDLPFTIPLINIRRIIGSYGVFIFCAFVLSILFSIGRAAYNKMKPK